MCSNAIYGATANRVLCETYAANTVKQAENTCAFQISPYQTQYAAQCTQHSIAQHSETIDATFIR